VTYAYECEHGHTFETEQRITDAPLTECTTRVPCPGTRKIQASVQCGGTVRRLLFPSGFALQGGGWASSGYSKGNK
jgi:predicted nucleic acid-binding Zn ribbon protein